MKDTTLAIAQVRANLPQIIKQVDDQFARFTVTVNGKEKAVILSPEEIKSYEATIEVLSDPQTLKDLAQSEKDWIDGNTYTFEDIEKA